MEDHHQTVWTVENLSSDDDGGYRKGCESSGAEVKGDGDWEP